MRNNIFFFSLLEHSVDNHKKVLCGNRKDGHADKLSIKVVSRLLRTRGKILTECQPSISLPNSRFGWIMATDPREINIYFSERSFSIFFLFVRPRRDLLGLATLRALWLCCRLEMLRIYNITSSPRAGIYKIGINKQAHKNWPALLFSNTMKWVFKMECKTGALMGITCWF